MKKILLFLLILLGYSGLSIAQNYKVEKTVNGRVFIDTARTKVLIDTVTEYASRTIYVATTGNDNTGTGLIGAPFLTISKALSTIRPTISSGITVTTHLIAGTYSMTLSSFNSLALFKGSGAVTIEGEMVLVESGFTMGAPLALDPFTYAVSGGNTASWTLDQWKFYFLKSSTSYYPITANALTPTISIAGDVTGTEIYETQSIVNFTGFSSDVTLTIDINNLKFFRVKLNLPNYNISFRSPNNVVTFQESYIIGQSKNLSYLKGARWMHSRSTFKTVYSLFQEMTGGASPNNFYYSTAAYTIQLSNISGIINVWNNNVIENTGTATTNAGIYIISSSYASTTTVNAYFKFVNTYYPIIYARSTDLGFDTQYFRFILVNCRYLFIKYSTIQDYERNNIRAVLSQIIGTPSIAWFYTTMYEFVNIATGRNIRIAGLIYPEMDLNQLATLVDNTTTNVIVGNKLQNRSISIEYTLTRGTGYRQGKIDILNDGTTVYMSPDEFITNGAAGVSNTAIVFAVDYNTNEIRLKGTLSSTGTGATIVYNVSRVMITPLTL